MIDVEKWEQMNDEQKLQLCNSIKDGVSVRSISKDDWKLMFDFLMTKVQGGSR